MTHAPSVSHRLESGLQLATTIRPSRTFVAIAYLVTKAMKLEYSCHGLTHCGLRRRNNQDQFLIARMHKSLEVEQTSISAQEHVRLTSQIDGRLLMVADGVGGHAAGEVASEIAVNSACEYVLQTIPWFYRLSGHSDDDFRDELKQALHYCQQRIQQATREAPEQFGMGTTLTMAYLVGRCCYLVHVGDSRCYLLRDQVIHRLTRDHTVAQQLVEAGQIAPEAAATSPFSHCLWNSVGGGKDSSLAPDVTRTTLQVGDSILLCTDGLTKHLADAEILQIVIGSDSEAEKCAALVAQANQAGGTDNVTVVLATLQASA
jgi:serine/threonine protein phosphatase PrpC